MSPDNIKKGDVHVLQADKRWRVAVEDSGGAVSTHRTQSEAWEKANKLARQERSEALLHGRNGRIRQRHTYGPDPRRIKG